MNFRTCLLLLSGIALLTGCGSGGGSLSGAVSDEVLSGVFSDSPVAGLEYTTPTLSGITNEQGVFQYRAGETVSFALGSTQLGAAPGAAELTPFHLTGAVVLTDVDEITAALEIGNSPYTRAVNMLRLLQTLDTDEDPANGIVIDSDTEALFEALELNFTGVPGEFANGPEVRELLTDMGRMLRKNELAIAHFYRTGEIEMFAKGRRLSRLMERTSESNDSSGAYNFIARYEYDAEGNQLSEWTENEGFGTVRRYQQRYTYNAAGYAVRSERTFEGDTVGESVAVRSYDVSGNRLRSDVDIVVGPGSGNVWIWTYDQRGLELSTEIDLQGDGLDVQTYISKYDDQGNLVLRRSDNNGDGEFEQETRNLYDSAGRLLETIISGSEIFISVGGGPPALGTGPEDYFDPEQLYSGDPNAPGIAAGAGNNAESIVRRFIRSNDGYLQRLEVDLDNDGSLESFSEYIYDNSGRLAQWRHTQVDFEGGPLGSSEVVDYSYDASGRLSMRERTQNRSVGPSSTETRRYEYDNQGRRSAMVIQGNSFISIPGRSIYEYDELGNLTRKSADGNLDGVPESLTRSVWEPSYRIDGNNNRWIY